MKQTAKHARQCIILRPVFAGRFHAISEWGWNMKYILPAVLLLLCTGDIAAAGSMQSTMLERRTARAIRNAGFWCDRVTDAQIDKVLSSMGPTVVRVTCDDKTRFEQYKLTMTKDNKIAKIETWK
jgi:hypothetical protein